MRYGDVLGPAMVTAIRELVRDTVREELQEFVRTQAQKKPEEPHRPPPSPPPKPVSTNPKRLLGIGEVEERLGVSRATVWRWYRAGRFPTPVYVGTRRAWRLETLEAWEAAEVSRPVGPDGRLGNLTRAKRRR